MLRNPEEYIESVYRARIERLLKEIKKEFPEDYRFFVKIKSTYTRKQATGSTTYTRLTRLRTACRVARELFGKPLSKLTRDEWEELSMHLYTMYRTRDAIVSAIHPLRLVLKQIGYDKEEIKELFPYPSSVKAKSQHEDPPPYVPGEILDRVVFNIYEDVYRALFCLMRITGARIEEITLLKRRNIISDDDGIYVRFDVTKNGLRREIPLNWPGFERHLKVFLAWYYGQHQDRDNDDAWLFPRTTDLSKPVPRNFAYLALKRAARKMAKRDREVRKYLSYIHPHQFRHTRAYELVFANWNVRWIMYYMGWKKIDMVLRYTRAFELRQVYKMMINGKQDNNGNNVKICPRCHALVPVNAMFCPYCGLRLVDYDIEEVIRKTKDKEKLLRLAMLLVEKAGAEPLKELLVSR